MKKLLLTGILVSLTSTAFACEYLGSQGVISDDGQRIVSAQPIALKEQAAKYGGYEGAAQYIEANRKTVMSNDHISTAVKQLVDQELRANVAQLQCWAAVCSKNVADPACHL
jgi:hypothetical protein